MKGFSCYFCSSQNTTFLKEMFDESGSKLCELWRCNACKKNFAVNPEDKLKPPKKTGKTKG